MGSSKKSKKALAESERLSKQTEAEAKQVKLTPEAEEVIKTAYADWKRLREGDVTGAFPVYQYLTRAGIAEKQAEEEDLLGGATLAERVANPNLMAQAARQRKLQLRTSQAADITNLLAALEADATNRILGGASTMASFAATRAGIYGGLSQDWFKRYQQFKQEGGFFKNVLGAAIGVGAKVLGGG